MTDQITQVYASQINGEWDIVSEGECPGLLIVDDNGNSTLNICPRHTIYNQGRQVIVEIYEFIKPLGTQKWLPYTSGNYPNNQMIADDFSFCLITGDGSVVGYEESHNEDGSLKEGYCTLYEFYKQTIGLAVIFPVDFVSMQNIINKEKVK